ncbi:MAG: (2Fe-2S)-binding protein [Gemmobacter sp.]|nr:(2Fe-2S)-binding protein [Gemmobacter sp.]
MIVCHCMNITDHDIRAAVDWMRASDAETIVTPGKIYHALGKRADCGGCMPPVFSGAIPHCAACAPGLVVAGHAPAPPQPP